nr:hypothetical protein [Tanacetum cinerariifolium]
MENALCSSLRFASLTCSWLRFAHCILLGKDTVFWFMRFVSCDLVLRFGPAFCLKTCCVLPKDKLRFASKLVAFCFKARCVFLQDTMRFASRHLAFYFKTFAFCLKILAFCLMVALPFVYFLKTLSAFW